MSKTNQSPLIITIMSIVIISTNVCITNERHARDVIDNCMPALIKFPKMS